MDFTFTPEQDEAAELAARILADRTSTERLRAVEAAGDRFDRDLWAALGEAGLLSLAVPEEHGGAGLGLVELCRVLVEVGTPVAPVPLATHGAVALLLAEHADGALQARWLPGAADGATVLTAAVAEERATCPTRPVISAEPHGDGWVLSGTKVMVRAGGAASGVRRQREHGRGPRRLPGPRPARPGCAALRGAPATATRWPVSTSTAPRPWRSAPRRRRGDPAGRAADRVHRRRAAGRDARGPCT